MANFEKFGSFLLLEEVGADCLGRVYRAAKLGQGGLDKVVYLTKIGQSLAQNAPLMKSLVDELKISAQITSPNIAKVYGCGKLEGAYFISWEFIEGKDLGVVFTRMGEGFPLAMDQNLYIISRIVAALETAHSLKVDDRAVIHGALSPVDVIITYEGDVKVKNFSIAPVLSKTPSERKEAYRKIETYLSPEVLDGQMPDKRSDIYALGLIFYRLLTGEPVFTGTRDIDLKQRLDSSQMMTPHNDEERIPAPISEIIMRCLQTNPAKRFASVKELKQAIEAAMLAGDISPSTFNLAFFMHTAFRSEIETEAKALQEERSINFLQYIEPPAKPAAPEHAPAAAGAAMAATTAAVPSAEADKKAPAAPKKAAVPAPAPSFMTEPEKKKSPVLLIVAALAVVGIGIGGYVIFKPSGPATPAPGSTTPAQLSPEQQAKLAQIEKEKIDAEQRTQALLQEMETLKQQLDAAQKKEEKDKLLKEFEAKRQLAAQAEKEKAAINAQAETIKKAAEEPPPAATTPATSAPGSETTTAQGGPPSTGSNPLSGPSAGSTEGGTTTGGGASSVPPSSSTGGTTGQPPVGGLPVAPPVSGVKEGDLVSFDSCDVKPKITRQAMPAFPPVAKKVGVSGTVVVSVLITETGAVAEALVKKASGSKYGFDEEAMKAAKKYQFSPGMKGGKRVKVWYELPAFVFKPSK